MKAADLVRWRKGQSRWRLVRVNAYGKKPGRDEGWALNWPTMLNHRDLDLFMRRQGAATAASGIAPLQGHAWRMELFPACFRKPADTGSKFGVVCLFMGKMVRPVHVHREAWSGKRCEGQLGGSRSVRAGLARCLVETVLGPAPNYDAASWLTVR